jgi:hypothetical protein
VIYPPTVHMADLLFPQDDAQTPEARGEMVNTKDLDRPDDSIRRSRVNPIPRGKVCEDGASASASALRS